jgi:phosphatidylserine/phosphatidylglycerophosphate/cardiolipin synthase-like enzyme
MNILPPHKISGVLFDIIHGAKKELVLVSPYVNLTYWKQLATVLIAARNRGIKIVFYVRHELGSPSRLVLRGVISGREAERFLAKQSKHFTSFLLRHDVQQGGKGYYDQLRSTLQAKLSAAKFNALTLPEKKELLTHVAYFLTALRAFKNDYR